MLQIKNVTITHKKDLRTILQDVSCVFHDGDKAVLIGEEGNGKSTLLKWIYDPGLIEAYAQSEGQRICSGERLGYLPQELPDEDKALALYEFFQREPMFGELTPGELARYAKLCRLPVDFFYGEQCMGTLSGGEKVKAQLLRLLMAQPTVLLLDEPSNDLDLETLEWLEEMIARWPRIAVFISHDETLIEHTANMVIHMEQIQRKTVSRCTVAHLPYRQYLQRRQDAFEKQEQQAISDRREKRIRDEKYRRIMQSVTRAQASINGAGKDLADKMQAARNLKDKMHTVKAMGRRFAREDEDMTQMPQQEEAIYFRLGGKDGAIPAGKTVLEYSLDALCAPDGRLLSRDIALRVRGPEKICIVGANGAGKTTLLRRMAEELLAREDIRAEYMPQEYGDLLDLSMTPVDYLDRTGEKQERTRIRTFLGALKYTSDEMDHPAAELSGGQKAKILLLRMSLSGANVLILDEPTRNFSPLSGPVIRRMLSEFPGAIISVSHDRKYIEEVCTKVYRLTAQGLQPEDSHM